MNTAGTDEWSMVEPATVVRGQTCPRTGVCLCTGAEPQRRRCSRDGTVDGTMGILERRYALRRRSSIQRVMPRRLAARVLLPSLRSSTA